MKYQLHVDLSGLGNSGKGILSDYLKEFNNVYVPRKDLEFNLLRAPGGLMDLIYSLHDNWTPIRSDDSIRRFKKLVDRLSARTKIGPINEMLNAAGYRYEDFYPGFKSLSDIFINSLISFTYKGLWPYVDYHSNTLELIYKRIFSKVNKQIGLENIYFSTGENLIEKINKYVYNVLDLAINENYKLYVTHNAFEPFESNRYLKTLKNSKSIIVVRDPRDVYTNVIEGNKEKSGFYKRMNPTFYNLSAASNLDSFITYQKKMLSFLNKYKNPNLLVLKFESFICDYATMSIVLNDFLQLDQSNHIAKLEYFNPNRSIKNVGIHTNFKNQESIEKIEKELNGFWDFT